MTLPIAWASELKPNRNVGVSPTGHHGAWSGASGSQKWFAFRLVTVIARKTTSSAPMPAVSHWSAVLVLLWSLYACLPSTFTFIPPVGIDRQKTRTGLRETPTFRFGFSW